MTDSKPIPDKKVESVTNWKKVYFLVLLWLSVFCLAMYLFTIWTK